MSDGQSADQCSSDMLHGNSGDQYSSDMSHCQSADQYGNHSAGVGSPGKSENNLFSSKLLELIENIADFLTKYRYSF